MDICEEGVHGLQQFYCKCAGIRMGGEHSRMYLSNYVVYIRVAGSSGGLACVHKLPLKCLSSMLVASDSLSALPYSCITSKLCRD